MSAPSPSRSTPFEPIWLTAAVLIVLGFAVLPNAFDAHADLFAREWFAGADTYMRLVRVREWIDGGAWYANVSVRSNWPYGETLHWTRPLDLLLVALALPFWPFAGLHKALYIAGVLSGPVLLTALMIVLVKGMGRLLDARGRVLLVLVAGLHPGVQHAFALARPDHHALILLAFAAVLGALARHAQNPQTHRAAAVRAGLACAFGLWISVEALVTFALALAALGVPWIVSGRDVWLDALRRFALAAALGLGAALLIERPPGDWLGSETYDRLSTVHVVMGALVAVVLGVLYRQRTRWTATAWTRLGAAAGAALLTGAALGMLYPDFFKGPFGAAMDSRLAELWLARIDEFRPLLRADAESAVLALLFIGPALWTAVWLSRTAPSGACSPRSAAVAFTFALFVAACAALTLAQVRWGGYVGLAAALPWAQVLAWVLDWQGGPRSLMAGGPPGTPVLRVPLFALVAVGHLIAAWALDAALADAPRAAARKCDWRGLADALNGPDFAQGRPLTLFTFMHKGPELLYRTPHRVVGTPYHRNARGLLDSFEVFTGVDMDRARGLLVKRQVDYVISCEGSPEEAFLLGVKDDTGGDTLIRRIHDGRLPAWLTPQPLPAAVNGETDGRFRVLRVRP